MQLSGGSMKDILCMGNGMVNCVTDFEFFVIRNQTDETKDILQRTSGVLGLAPDEADNGPSFLTSLRALKKISSLQVGIKMNSMGGGSKLTMGGYD